MTETLIAPSSRAELAEEVRRIRDLESLTWAEIGRRLGISRSYAAELYSDPLGDLARARKESYRGECIDCGGPTCGADGPAHAPERCATCARLLQHEERAWTPDTIAVAFRSAELILGRPPTVGDVQVRTPSIRAGMSAARIVQGEKLRAAMDAGFRFPTPRTVRKECGSWEAALERAKRAAAAA